MRDFIPLPAALNSTPDPVREFIYFTLQLKALQQIYMEARGRSGEALSQSMLEILQIEIDVSAQDMLRIPKTGPVVANHSFGLKQRSIPRKPESSGMRQAPASRVELLRCRGRLTRSEHSNRIGFEFNIFQQPSVRSIVSMRSIEQPKTFLLNMLFLIVIVLTAL